MARPGPAGIAVAGMIICTQMKSARKVVIDLENIFVAGYLCC